MSASGAPMAIPPGACDESRTDIPLGVSTTLVAIGLVVVTFRCFSRLNTQKGLQADDYTMFTALIFGLTNYGVGVANGQYGIGKHIFCIELPDLINALRLLFISEILTFLAIFFVKLSVTLFLLSLGGLRKSLRVSLVINVVLLALSTIAFIVVLLVQCRPIAGNWDPVVMATANCLPPNANVDVSYAAAVISVLTDFGCVCLPFPIIWNLKMSLKTKISVLSLMCLGIFAMVCGIVRATQVNGLRDTSDITWAVIPVGSWTDAELYIGIIAGSLPACRVLFLQIVAKMRSQPPPSTQNTIGQRSHGSGRSFMLQSLSQVGRILTGNRRSPPDSFKLPDNNQSPAWKAARKRAGSDGSVLPLHESEGITKTIDVQVQRGNDRTIEE